MGADIQKKSQWFVHGLLWAMGLLGGEMNAMLGQVYRDCRLKDFQCDGLCIVEDAKLEGETKVRGFLQAKNVHFDTLTLHGSVHLDNCHIEKHSHFFGQASLHHSHFKEKVYIHSNTIKAHYGIFNDIDIHNDNKEVGFECTACVVHGHIRFTGQPGHVVLRQGGVVHGKVINGTKITEEGEI